MIATIGEALVDLIEQPDGNLKACLGGSVCNFTLGLVRQGIAATYMNPLSQDRFGKRFLALLSDNGVNLAHSAGSACPTALAVVSLDAQGSPSYAFYREGVADRDISAAMLVDGFPDALCVLHTGGLALVPDDIGKILAAIEAAKMRGALVSIDANLRPMVVKEKACYIGGVRAAIRQAHIVKVSDEDLVSLGIDSVRPDELAEILFDDSDLQLIALTRGAQAAVLLTRHLWVELPTPRGLKVVDTVGAGDCFHAGLIAYLQRAEKLSSVETLAQLDQDTLRAALQHAISSASINITRAGCDPATWEQTTQFSRHCQTAPLPAGETLSATSPSTAGSAG